MKNALIAVLLLTATASTAQKYQIGLKGGVNISNFTAVPFNNVSKSALVSFHGGGFINFLLGDNFSIQPEALFSTQGSKLDDGTNKLSYKVSYLSIPVMAKFEFNGGFFLEAGPQFSFKLSEDVPNSSVGDFAKSLDLAAAAGLGFHGKSGFGIGGRYLAGISKVGDFSSTAARNPDFKNSTAQIYIFLSLFNNRR